MINYETATFEDYIFPAWADAIGILIGLTTLVPIPIYTMYLLFKRKIVSISQQIIIPTIKIVKI